MPRNARAVRPASRTGSGWLSLSGSAVAVTKLVAGLPSRCRRRRAVANDLIVGRFS